MKFVPVFGAILLLCLSVSPLALADQPKVPFQQQLFEFNLQAIEKIQNEKNLDEYFTHDRSAAMRTGIFQIAELLRDYSTVYKSAGLNELYDQVKFLEREAGNFTDLEDLIKFAKTATLSAETQSYLKGQRDQLRKQIISMLKEGPLPWFGTTGILQRIRDTIEDPTKIEWKKKFEDRIDNLDYIDGRAADIQKRFKDGVYKKGVVEGEDSLHQLRRDLRKISIIAQALNNLNRLALSAPQYEELAQYISDPIIMNNPYRALTNASPGKHAVLIPEDVYKALTWSIQQLGVVKDILFATAKDLGNGEQGRLRELLSRKGGELPRTEPEGAEGDAAYEKRVDAKLKELVALNPEWSKLLSSTRPDWELSDLNRVTDDIYKRIPVAIDKLRDSIQNQRYQTKKSCRKAVAAVRERLQMQADGSGI